MKFFGLLCIVLVLCNTAVFSAEVESRYGDRYDEQIANAESYIFRDLTLLEERDLAIDITIASASAVVGSGALLLITSTTDNTAAVVPPLIFFGTINILGWVAGTLSTVLWVADNNKLEGW